jgi:hypothetical protein
VVWRLPPNVPIEIEDEQFRPKLCVNYNALKIIVALAQTLYAVSALHDSCGDQIERFGYAAFGLTVTPYLFMSIMKLIANLLRPNYPTLYMVESQDMLDAAATGDAKFVGTVIRLSEPHDDSLDQKLRRQHSESVARILAFCLGFVPLAVIGGMAHFHTKVKALMLSVSG